MVTVALPFLEDIVKLGSGYLVPFHSYILFIRHNILNPGIDFLQRIAVLADRDICKQSNSLTVSFRIQFHCRAV